MREVVLDTETTGLDPDAGDRIVELGAVELLNHMPTGRVFHAYVNPRREVPEEAVRVHGLTTAFLADKPVFAMVAADFAAFLGDSRLVIHNAAFDIRFLNAELGWCGPGGEHVGRLADVHLVRCRGVGGLREQRLHRRLVTGGGAHVDRARRAGLVLAAVDAEVAEVLLGGWVADEGAGVDVGGQR